MSIGIGLWQSNVFFAELLRVMCLPTGTAVNPEDIKLICVLIATAIKHSEELNRALDG